MRVKKPASTHSRNHTMRLAPVCARISGSLTSASIASSASPSVLPASSGSSTPNIADVSSMRQSCMSLR